MARTGLLKIRLLPNCEQKFQIDKVPWNLITRLSPVTVNGAWISERTVMCVGNGMMERFKRSPHIMRVTRREGGEAWPLWGRGRNEGPSVSPVRNNVRLRGPEIDSSLRVINRVMVTAQLIRILPQTPNPSHWNVKRDRQQVTHKRLS